MISDSLLKEYAILVNRMFKAYQVNEGITFSSDDLKIYYEVSAATAKERLDSHCILQIERFGQELDLLSGK